MVKIDFTTGAPRDILVLKEYKPKASIVLYSLITLQPVFNTFRLISPIIILLAGCMLRINSKSVKESLR